jgi:exosortase
MSVPAPRLAHPPGAWLRAPLVLAAGPAVLLVAGLCLYLAPEWSRNPDLSHGLFAPVVFAVLLWEGTRQGKVRWVRPGPVAGLLLATVLAAALAMAALGGLLAASVGWSHAVVRFALASSAAGFLLGALLVLASERVRAVPLNWATFTAVALWVLAAPLPTGTYAQITLALQGWVTTGVLNALHILGIPARQMGNIIELATTTVGVEEACSGIRSLISCLYAGLFFSAWLLRTPGKRIVLVVLAPLLAIGMNFARSLGLTLLANSGVEILGFWHDATGYAILGLTALTLAGLASLLSPNAPETPAAAEPAGAAVPGAPAAWGYFGGVALLAALAVAFVALSRPTGSGDRPPDLTDVLTLLPAEPAGWSVRTTDDLNRFSGILQTRHLAERTYARATAQGRLEVNAYVAHWNAGAAPVSLVASHTPDACWPGAGWIPEPNPDRQAALTTGERTLPLAEQRVFRFGEQPQHVWYWHIYDGRVISYRDPYSIPALVEIALRYGFRREGSQYFVRLSSNRPWEDIRDEPLVRELAANLARIGLAP